MATNEFKSAGTLLAQVAAGVAGVLLAASAASAAPINSDERPAVAHLEVAYAPSLQGTEAMFAVRVCSRGEGRDAPLVRETLVDGKDDIVVRLVSADGREISRYAGSAAVCDYAKFAAAFVARSGDVPDTGLGR